MNDKCIAYQVLLRINRSHSARYAYKPSISQLRRATRAIVREFPAFSDYHSHDENIAFPHLHILVFVSQEKETIWLARLANALESVDKNNVFRLLAPIKLKTEKHITNTINYQLAQERVNPATPVYRKSIAQVSGR